MLSFSSSGLIMFQKIASNEWQFHSRMQLFLNFWAFDQRGRIATPISPPSWCKHAYFLIFILVTKSACARSSVLLVLFEIVIIFNHQLVSCDSLFLACTTLGEISVFQGNNCTMVQFSHLLLMFFLFGCFSFSCHCHCLYSPVILCWNYTSFPIFI